MSFESNTSTFPASSSLAYEQMTLPRGWSALILTECRYTARINTMYGGLPDTAAWRVVLQRIIEVPSSLTDYAVLKYSETGEVFSARFEWSGGSVRFVAKQSRARGWLRRAVAASRPSRARRNFARALRLLDAGVGTAIPLALVERKRGHEAWLISEYVDGLVDLDHVAMSLLPRVETRRRRVVKDAIVEGVVELFVRLQRGRWYHRDLKASNILLTNWDGVGLPARVWLMDLDGLRSRRPWERIPDDRPLVRLAASLFGYAEITMADHARLVRRYLAASQGSDIGWREAFRSIASRAGAYNSRAIRRKGAKLDGFGG